MDYSLLTTLLEELEIRSPKETPQTATILQRVDDSQGGLFQGIHTKIKQQTKLPNGKYSALRITRALFNFLIFIAEQTPYMNPHQATYLYDPNERREKATEGNNLLNILRLEVARFGIPHPVDYMYYQELNEDETFLSYWDSLPEDQRQTVSGGIIPPLFNLLEIAAAATECMSVDNPEDISASSPQRGGDDHFYIPPIVDPTSTTASSPSPSSNPTTPQQTNNNGNVVDSTTNTPAQSTAMTTTTITTSTANTSSQRGLLHQSSSTTHPQPTLRALIWKTFVMGPILLNRLHLGNDYIGIPEPYVLTKPNDTTVPLASPGSSRRGAWNRDTSRPPSARISGNPGLANLTNNSSSSLANNNTTTMTTGGLNLLTPADIDQISHHSESQMSSSTGNGSSIGALTSTNSKDINAAAAAANNNNNTTTKGSLKNAPKTLPRNQLIQGVPRVQPTSTDIPPPTIYLSAQQYLNVLCRGKSKRYHLIRDDSFRTFRTNLAFLKTVPEQALIRVLNAFDLQYEGSDWQYTQGMNVYAGAFLDVMPELDAYNCVSLFVTKYSNNYWKANHIGVEAGCKLLDEILKQIDPEVHRHLVVSHNPPLTGILYAYSFVKTMSASGNPLSEAIKLWDIQLAFGGPGFGLCCLAAQIVNIRQDILASTFPKAILDYRKWPSLNSQKIVSGALYILNAIAFRNPRLLNDLCAHATDIPTVERVTGRILYAREQKP